MRTKRFFKQIIAVLSVFTVTIFANPSVYASNAPEAKANKTIVEIATSEKDFSILTEALVKADLVDALNQSGELTVFAPTNDAFKELFNTLGVDGISDLTKKQLTPILLNHVLKGKVMASDVKSGEAPTLNEMSSIEIKKSMDGVKINGSSNVIKADISASNGVIHVIDAVLVPTKAKKSSSSSNGSC
jgi:transforming growth factor-beta-induced protein